MRNLLVAVAMVFGSVSAYAQHHGGGHMGGGHMGGGHLNPYHHGSHHGFNHNGGYGHHGFNHNGGYGHHGWGMSHVAHGPVGNLGYTFNGQRYRHWCFGNTWRGWTERRWYAAYGTYIYWSPVYSCWYRWYPVQQVFVPCDEWVTDQSNVVDDEAVDLDSVR